MEPKPTQGQRFSSGVRPVRVALAHDWLVGLRGGEVVLDAIVRTIDSTRGVSATTLYTLFSSGEPPTPRIGQLRLRASSLNGLPSRSRRWLLPVYPAGVAELSRRLSRDHRVEPVDLLLSTSSVAAKAIRPPEGVPHLCYCHTPARYLWDQKNQYKRGPGDGLGGAMRSAGLGVLGPWLRKWDRTSVSGITRVLANSRFTADRIQRCWGVDAGVLYPPIDTAFFTPDLQTPRADFWLVVSALEPYKRTDLVIDAAQRTGQRLVIVGKGSQSRRLHARCSGFPGITVRDWVSREELRTLYQTARCLVFPQVEDFGMAAAEAQACGCPVAARSIGGASEIVIDRVTGSLIHQASAEGILEAINQMPEACDKACRSNAERFGAPRFAHSMLREMAGVLGRGSLECLSVRSGF